MNLDGTSQNQLSWIENDFHNLMEKLAYSSQTECEDLLTVELDEALSQALEAHPEWCSEWRTRQAFDRQLTDSMTQLDVPTTAKDALLDELTAATTTSIFSTRMKSARWERRRATGLFAAASFLFVTAILVFVAELNPTLTITLIENDIPRLWEHSSNGLEVEASESQKTVLPRGGWKNQRIQFSKEWKQTPLSSTPDEVVCYRRFTFRTNNGAFHRGMLVSLPASRFSDDSRPKTSDPFSGDIRYLSTVSGETLAIVSWTDRETQSVYLLAVPAEHRTLDALDRLLYSNPV